MSKRRSTTDNRCHKCKIRKELCFCESLIPTKTKTQVSIFMHIKEFGLTSNTGRISHYCLENSSIHVRGKLNPDPSDELALLDGHTPLLLFPAENAIELTPEYCQKISKPVQLIVPDATWRQAKKFHKREHVLKNIQPVTLAGKYQSKYTLRRQNSDNGLCTLEAIAFALKALERGTLATDRLLAILAIMNHRVNETRTSHPEYCAQV